MPSKPEFDLTRLREIGWDLWDPIGLRGVTNVDDEYDRYLLRAADRIWSGADEHKIKEYLRAIEANGMGLGDSESGRRRAAEAARALIDYVETLRC